MFLLDITTVVEPDPNLFVAGGADGHGSMELYYTRVVAA